MSIDANWLYRYGLAFTPRSSTATAACRPCARKSSMWYVMPGEGEDEEGRRNFERVSCVKVVRQSEVVSDKKKNHPNKY
jgi:hypothetical protein